jgi:hypothetical protein
MSEERYREKSCKKCGKTHKKRGPYCSKVCSNKDREVTEETRAKLTKASREYQETPEAIANRRQLVNKNQTKAEDFAIAIPDVRDISDYDFLDDYPKTSL